jgi:hypothetical protein
MAWYYWPLGYWLLSVLMVYVRGYQSGTDRAMYPEGRWKYYAHGLWMAPVAFAVCVIALPLLGILLLSRGLCRAREKTVRPPE